jgi:endonuclease/exonuclease/phosphatase family metal-dependent hydrolase
MSKGQEANTHIRVASYNIGDFSTASDRSGDGIPKGNGTEVTKAEYIAAFKKIGADLWGLQEDSPCFCGTTEESPYDAIYSKIHPFYKRHFTGTYNGKAFLSSCEIKDVEAIDYPAAVTSYAPQGTKGYGHKWYLRGKVELAGKEIAIVTLHFDWACKERRAKQIETVIEFAQKQEYCLIIGDFNPDDYLNGEKLSDVRTYVEDCKKFTDAGFVGANAGDFGVFSTIMKGGKPREENYPCDNIFVTPNIKILNAEAVYEPWMDDHAILVADIEIH